MVHMVSSTKDIPHNHLIQIKMALVNPSFIKQPSICTYIYVIIYVLYPYNYNCIHHACRVATTTLAMSPASNSNFCISRLPEIQYQNDVIPFNTPSYINCTAYWYVQNYRRLIKNISQQ